jgi:hypothetical protein
VQSTIVAAYGKRPSCFRLEKYTLHAYHFEILDLMRRRNIDVCLVEGLGRLRACAMLVTVRNAGPTLWFLNRSMLSANSCVSSGQGK